MKHYNIQSTDSKTTLYEGKFKNFKTCLERAAQDNIDLSHADLRHKNLTNINIDDSQLKHADFSGSNLTGANLSEANLYGATFHHTALYNTCMAYANLQHCDFKDTSFGATDITGSNISFAHFSTLSCFDLDFTRVTAMKNCTFKNPNGLKSPMNRPPVIIKGLGKLSIIIMDQHIKIDHDVMDTLQWLKQIIAPATPKNKTLN